LHQEDLEIINLTDTVLLIWVMETNFLLQRLTKLLCYQTY
jgi:hypothetical protein